MNRPIIARRATPPWKIEMTVQRWVRANIQYILIPFALALMLTAWELVVLVNQYPSFILPTPRQVVDSLIENWTNGILPRHLSITLFEIALATSVSITFATVIGYVLGKSP